MSSEDSAAGKNNEGGSFIPASQRPDGTWRKPRRVRDGYVPQEEVPLYESKGRQIAAKQNSNCPVGIPPEMVAEAKAKREAKLAEAKLAEAKREAKLAEARREARLTEARTKEKAVMKAFNNCQMQGFATKVDNGKKAKKSDLEEVSDYLARASLGSSSSANSASNARTVPPPEMMFDPNKKLKNLKKKLREIEVLEAKLANGEIENPEKDQLEKVKNKHVVAGMIERLEELINN